MNTIDLQRALVHYLHFTRRDGHLYELCTGPVPVARMFSARLRKTWKHDKRTLEKFWK